MVLNDEQNDRFFDTMDELLYYVNDRFRVVENFELTGSTPLDEVKSSLVARTLWENVEIIDDFVRDYANRLPRKCLELALSWKYALPGFYTLVRYQSGRALLMSEAGVFSVCGVTYELEQEIGSAPAYVEMVLLPFDDLIVYDGFLQAYDTDRTSYELQRIQDDFENKCAKGIAVTGADFIHQAKAFLADQRDRELDALLADVARESERGEEKLPEGYHRGALAGLDAMERESALVPVRKKRAQAEAPTVREFDRRARNREPVTSLTSCLSLMTKPQLESVAQALGMGGLIRLRKSEMVAELAAELSGSLEALEAMLTIVGDACFELAHALAKGKPIQFGVDEIADHVEDWPIEPYVYLFKHAKTYTAIIPDELKPLFKSVDFDEVIRVRRQQRQALLCADACAVMCGTASIDDVYDQYRALVADVFEREEFEALIKAASRFGGTEFELWMYPPTEYLVHYTLSPDFVAQDLVSWRSDEMSHLYRDRETGEFATDSFKEFVGAMRSDLKFELESLEQYKRSLVESQSHMPMKPLSRSLLENDIIGELLDNPSVVRLRAFLDERIPDGEDDYTFADRIVEQLVYTAIESGNLQGMFSYAIELGLEDCADDEQRLSALITNVYNAMPSWENNGWSPQELLERVTGRKMFYNEDGSVMKIGADDPCPCGSGRKYRECCGR